MKSRKITHCKGEPNTIGDYFEEKGKLEAIASGRLALPEPKE